MGILEPVSGLEQFSNSLDLQYRNVCSKLRNEHNTWDRWSLGYAASDKPLNSLCVCYQHPLFV